MARPVAPGSTVSTRPATTVYGTVAAILAATITVLVWITAPGAVPSTPDALVPPLFAMLGLTAVVWLAMAVVRHVAVAAGKASPRYYHAYTADMPDERIERPARTFNNLMQLPMLFYVVCLLMIATGRLDTIQVSLAWLFVALRVIHAVVLIGWNYVPYRFATYAAGAITLGVLAVRTALQTWPQP